MALKNENRGAAVAEYQKNKRLASMERVRSYYELNPFTTAKGAALALGMHYVTVTKYVREIRKQDQAKG